MDSKSEIKHVEIEANVDTSDIDDLIAKFEHLGEILKEVNLSLDKLASKGIHLFVTLNE